MNSKGTSRLSGAVLIDKPEGVTSFGALSSIKKRVGHGKVGHAGTLDKFASGLLIVLIGPYTKLTTYFSGLDKTYRGSIRFGETTTTLDPEGELSSGFPIPSYETIEKGVENFTGTFDQVPPQYSAVHVGGKRAYRRALSGEEVEIPSRQVHIYDFEVEGWNQPDLLFSLSCSKGTYVRSIARDLGVYCGGAAYLYELRRTSISSFYVEESVSPENFDPERDFLSDRRILGALPNCRTAVLKDEAFDRVQNGSEIDSRALTEESRGQLASYTGSLGLLDKKEKLIAMTDYREGRFTYRFVVPRDGARDTAKRSVSG